MRSDRSAGAAIDYGMACRRASSSKIVGYPNFSRSAGAPSPLSPVGGSDHPRHGGDLPQQQGEAPAQRKRAGEHDRKLDARWKRIVIDGVLQPDDEDVVQEVDAVSRGLHRIEQA